jgi:hypothetical protein
VVLAPDQRARYVFNDLKTPSWITLILSGLEILASLSLSRGLVRTLGWRLRPGARRDRRIAGCSGAGVLAQPVFALSVIVIYQLGPLTTGKGADRCDYQHEERQETMTTSTVETEQRPVRRAKQLELAFVEHDWTKLRHPGGRLLDGVDVGIAPLIESLWARGYVTKSSCENGGEVYGWCPLGMAYVSFATAAECERFARELCGLAGYDPLRRVEFIQLSAYPQTIAFEARLIEEAAQRPTSRPSTSSPPTPTR